MAFDANACLAAGHSKALFGGDELSYRLCEHRAQVYRDSECWVAPAVDNSMLPSVARIHGFAKYCSPLRLGLRSESSASILKKTGLELRSDPELCSDSDIRKQKGAFGFSGNEFRGFSPIPADAAPAR